MVFRPASNDIFTFEEVFIDQVYGPVTTDVPRATTVIDLGANIGLSSLYFLRRYPRCRVFAVEPDAENARLLGLNLRGPRAAGRAVVVRAAVWSTDGPVHFVPPAEPGHVNQGAVKDVAGVGGSEVSGLTAASIIAKSGFERVDILKVDVEGGERHLFSGGAEWLDRVGCLAVEFHDGSRAESGFDRAVTAAGFRITEHGHTVVARQTRW